MGSCVSVHRDPESAMRFRLAVGSGSRGDNKKQLFAPDDKVGGAHHPAAAAGDDADLSGNKRVDSDLGFRSSISSKEDAFFDSQALLESDCEDDFFSVNGEFTPSRGSTPNYQTGTPMTPRLNKAFLFAGFPDTKSEPSPRKKLAELLQETLPGEPTGDEYNAVNGKVEVNENSEVNRTTPDKPLKSLDGTQDQSGTVSVGSSDKTPNADFKTGKEKRGKAMQCCLPSLVHSLSFNERKKQTPSPGCRVVG